MSLVFLEQHEFVEATYSLWILWIGSPLEDDANVLLDPVGKSASVYLGRVGQCSGGNGLREKHHGIGIEGEILMGTIHTLHVDYTYFTVPLI